MAARKKSTARASSAKKSSAKASVTRTTRKAATTKSAKATRKKATPARAAATPAKATRAKVTKARKAVKKAPRRSAAAEAKPSAVETLARTIVQLTTQQREPVALDAIYASDCISIEPGTEAAIGIEGLEAKIRFWNSIQKRSTWKAIHVFTQGDTICIEWTAEVELRDGRTVQFEEVAVHKVKGGKIVEERYYYDPSVLAPPLQPAEGDAPPAPIPQRKPTPPSVELHGSPAIDPMDL